MWMKILKVSLYASVFLKALTSSYDGRGPVPCWGLLSVLNKTQESDWWWCFENQFQRSVLIVFWLCRLQSLSTSEEKTVVLMCVTLQGWLMQEASWDSCLLSFPEFEKKEGKWNCGGLSSTVPLQLSPVWIQGMRVVGAAFGVPLQVLGPPWRSYVHMELCACRGCHSLC